MTIPKAYDLANRFESVYKLLFTHSVGHISDCVAERINNRSDNINKIFAHRIPLLTLQRVYYKRRSSWTVATSKPQEVCDVILKVHCIASNLYLFQFDRLRNTKDAKHSQTKSLRSNRHHLPNSLLPAALTPHFLPTPSKRSSCLAKAWCMTNYSSRHPLRHLGRWWQAQCAQPPQIRPEVNGARNLMCGWILKPRQDSARFSKICLLTEYSRWLNSRWL